MPAVTDAESALLFGTSAGMPILALTEVHYTVDIRDAIGIFAGLCLAARHSGTSA